MTLEFPWPHKLRVRLRPDTRCLAHSVGYALHSRVIREALANRPTGGLVRGLATAARRRADGPVCLGPSRKGYAPRLGDDRPGIGRIGLCCIHVSSLPNAN